MSVRFVYFDLGKVLVDFDVDLLCAQVAQAADVEEPIARAILFDEHLQAECEVGAVTTDEFCRAFRDRTGSRVGNVALVEAASAIFTPMPESFALVRSLRSTGMPTGILSNTCDGHWKYCTRHYEEVSTLFDVHVLSHEVRAAKPDPAIYREAIRLAGVEPGEIFFVDDRLENVEGARLAGIDAEPFTNIEQLRRSLGDRGIGP